MDEAARRDVDSALALAQARSFWRDTISWPDVRNDVLAFAAGARTAADTYPALRELVARLGDHHSSFMPAERAAWEGADAARNPSPDVTSLDGRVGYVQVPTSGGADDAAGRAYAAEAYQRMLLVAA